MPATIPPTILLIKERAESLLRTVKILYTAWHDPPSYCALHQALAIIHDLAWMEYRRYPSATPLVALEGALEWAYRKPPPPIAQLVEAREALETAASCWAEAVTQLRNIITHRTDLQPAPWPDWLFEFERAVMAEKRRIDLLLQESWPVGVPQEDMDALGELKEGVGLDLDEAFAQIVGTNKREWAQRVKRHKENHPKT